jgi:hypothetical protein
MNRYLAKLMFNINIDNQNRTSQFDEQIRVIYSHDFDNAFQKARTIGKQEEETFLNKDNTPVNWKFIDVVELYPLEEMKDGEQVYSLTHEGEDTKTFINYIRHKSMLIQTKNLTFA